MLWCRPLFLLKEDHYTKRKADFVGAKRKAPARAGLYSLVVELFGEGGQGKSLWEESPSLVTDTP